MIKLIKILRMNIHCKSHAQKIAAGCIIKSSHDTLFIEKRINNLHTLLRNCIVAVSLLRVYKCGILLTLQPNNCGKRLGQYCLFNTHKLFKVSPRAKTLQVYIQHFTCLT